MQIEKIWPWWTLSKKSAKEESQDSARNIETVENGGVTTVKSLQPRKRHPPSSRERYTCFVAYMLWLPDSETLPESSRGSCCPTASHFLKFARILLITSPFFMVYWELSPILSGPHPRGSGRATIIIAIYRWGGNGFKEVKHCQRPGRFIDILQHTCCSLPDPDPGELCLLRYICRNYALRGL